MLGYWDKPEETAAAMRGGRLHSGDLGRLGEDGYLQLTGRSKELYKSGGELVMPKEIEELLSRHPGISQAYAVGVPDDRWGEVGTAFVVLRDDAQLGEPALRAHLESQLARYKVPRYIHFVPDLPVSATGKVRRVELRVRAAEHLSAPPVEGATP